MAEAAGTTASSSSTAQFNRDVRPLLAEHCLACHGADAGKRKAGLRLDTREGLYGATREDGPVITPGQPERSALWKRITHADPEEVMPPPQAHKDLSVAQRDLLRNWIVAGAPWQPHWSFLKPERPIEPGPSPAAARWIRNPVDAFVHQRLEAAGLEPAPEAERSTLVRRVTLDLTGLPPSPEDLAAVERDRSPDWYEHLVDRLLDRPAWGEHRARAWLDAARYADTHGLHFDNYREMWLYRDWVIRAFNRNQPFDQFTVEQLAGDLLPDPTEDQLTATGFHRCNMTTNEGGTIEEENLSNYARDRVETTSAVWLGLTANCASCHDHKFDPISLRDFYSMAAYFRNTRQGGFDGNVKDSNPSLVLPQDPAERARWAALPGEVEGVKQRLENRRKDSRTEFTAWLDGLSLDRLPADPDATGLVVHAPLQDGAGETVTLKAGAGLTAQATGKLEWKDGGPLGRAPVLQPGSTFDLGNLGDFERDQSFSYGAWVRVPSGGRYQAVLARMDQANGFRGWDLFTHDRNWAVHLVHRWPEEACKVVTTGDPIRLGEWQHVFVTYDGSGRAEGVRVYVNGSAMKTRAEKDTLGPSIRTSVPLRIGQRSKDEVFSEGQVQDVRVYARRLEPWDVRTLAQDSPIRGMASVPAGQRTPAQQEALYEFYLGNRDAGTILTRVELARLESERDTLRKRSPVTHVQRERTNSEPMARVLFRGQYDKPRDEVRAAPFGSLHAFPEGAPRNRLGLARWIVSPENPLTARVVVNRYWQEVFGTGIVRSVEDFGTMGEGPVNPDLLDWLAVEFREGGWDTKRIFRLLVTSATYRQSAVTTPAKLEKDPSNRLLSRGPRFRMEAEMIRDYALAVSGLLNAKVGGPSVKPYQPDGVWEAVAMPESNTKKYVRDRGEGLYRRSLYTFWKRAAPPAFMEIFNAPSRETCTVRRERTDTPLQALATLNDPQLLEAARQLAQSALREPRRTPGQPLAQVAERILTRPLRAQELAIATRSHQRLLDHYRANPGEAVKLLSVGDTWPDPRLSAPEVAALTLMANQFLNLDEVLNK
jgi:hypothetical protein